MNELNNLAGRLKNRLHIGDSHPSSNRFTTTPPQGPEVPAATRPYHSQTDHSVPQQGLGTHTSSSYLGTFPTPPPVPSGRPQNMSSPPIVPPRPTPETSPPSLDAPPSITSPSPPKAIPQAGAIYPPGEYPTPELPLYPLQKHIILKPGSDAEYTSAAVQKALNDIGAGTVYLPAGSVWKVEESIYLADFQELATLGYPTREEEMATLDAQEGLRGHLLHAFDKRGIRIRNLIFEGNKEKYGWDDHGALMIQLGGAKGPNQVLDRCIVRNPRNWSCIHAYEGGQNVRITNNAIGPAGVGADKESGHWADGISYAATDGLVAGNLVIDTTDGGIVLFNAPASLITSNTIVTGNSMGLGAINMVDWYIDSGNYGFTRVTHNTIVTAGTMLKIGVGQGPSVWWQQNEKRQINRGATVSYNLITRDTSRITHPSSPSYNADLGLVGTGTIGYGFPIGSDIADWTCVDNVSEDDVRYEGDISGTLPNFLNAAPAPLVHDRWGNAEGDEADMSGLRLQPEFVQGKIWGLLDIKPGPSKVLAFDGGGLVMRKNEVLSLNGIEVAFGGDLELRVRDATDGAILWEAGIRNILHPQHYNAENPSLRFTSSGKLLVTNGDDTFYDLSPHVPASLPPSPSPRPSSPRLMFSSSKPYVLITSSSGNVLYASHYSVPRFSTFPVGKFVARPTPHAPFHGGALVYSMSPQCQFGVAHTREELNIEKLEWPLDYSKWTVLKVIGSDQPRPGMDMGGKMSLQGDGHLLIFDGAENCIWGSGTHGDRGADKLLFGAGSEQEPYLELVKDDGRRLWAA
ncbi:hypothetical protein DL93DRAFT_2160417 [Clavulina sp. PMI_390]|nr:hypothetical protein DL93DRAFT_2160417 [Clavulina sp. PMI_390]